MAVEYVDEARTHAVRLAVETSASGIALHVVESAFGEADPSASLRSTLKLGEAWELGFHRAELEARLGMLGRYWRHDGGAWTAVPQRPAVVDVRPFALEVGATRADVHHFHHPARAGRMLVALPQDPAGKRSVLAELEVDGLRTRAAHLLHPSLPEAPLRSLLLERHLRARDAGYAKLRTDGEMGFVYGPGWRERIAQAIATGVETLARGGLQPEPDASSSAGAADAASLDVLDDPRLARVHAAFLQPGEETSLLSGGELAIRRAITEKRRSAEAQDQHLLSIVEASLLVRERLQRGSLVDAQLLDRVRRLGFYLGTG